MVAYRRLGGIAAILWLTAVGCNPAAAPVKSGKNPPETPAVWLERGLKIDDMTVEIGYRNREGIQPVIAITKEGKPVADAMVFVQLLSTGEQAQSSPELATVFETDGQGKSVYCTPTGISGGEFKGMRWRVIFAGKEQEWTQEVEIPAAAR